MNLLNCCAYCYKKQENCSDSFGVENEFPRENLINSARKLLDGFKCVVTDKFDNFCEIFRLHYSMFLVKLGNKN